MKLSLYVFLGLLTCSFVARSQTVPEGASTLEVTTTLADSTLFESVLSHLEDEGFDIEVADESQKSIVTEYQGKTESSRIRILATIDNGVALFKGQCSGESGGATYDNESLVNEQSASEFEKVGFLWFNQIVTRYARSLDQATLEYHEP
ncbi:hypothetical protein ACFSUS_26040 [Spirosoma soli]|uniref:Uncharacterized protein n=1 Tax=Spirosoma soli TaxID=1770529 RepID=A0ABW5MCY0_9BACT